MEKWKSYYASRPKYPKVGRVMHMPIEYNTPLPAECGKDGPTAKPLFGPGSPIELEKEALRESARAAKTARKAAAAAEATKKGKKSEL